MRSTEIDSNLVKVSPEDLSQRFLNLGLSMEEVLILTQMTQIFREYRAARNSGKELLMNTIQSIVVSNNGTKNWHLQHSVMAD